jgi:hypothetical protein
MPNSLSIELPFFLLRERLPAATTNDFAGSVSTLPAARSSR